jgi:uncharacterized membrane protein
MNIVLWIVQVLVGLAFIMVGVNHGFRAEQIKTQQGMQWVSALPQGLLLFIGICEILGGVGVILPAATGVLSWLTPLAAALLAVMMLLAAGFHLPRKEYPNMVFNLILLALAAFIAYGRYFIAPI